jgi:lipopolysaccharide assembly outer membrane protein LptD (OstA)
MTVKEEGYFMKHLILKVAVACQIFGFGSQAISQENKTQPERLHLMRPFPESGTGRVELAASNAQRDLSREVLQLRGNVEVRMITCGPADHDEVMVCDKGSMVLHADEVDYNEKTGEIDARGDVCIAPYRAIPKMAISK